MADETSPSVGWDINPELQRVGVIPDLERVVADIAREEGWAGVRCELTAGTKAGDNYVGVIYRVTITGERNRRQVTKSLICKTDPDNQERRVNFRTEGFFKTEAVFYNDVLTAYQKFQTERGLPLSRHFSALPSRCYHASSTLILEDMCPAGFTMRDRREGMDVDHCRLVVRELGHLHALSFALRDQNPEEFHRLTSQLQENLFTPRENQNQSMLTQYENFTNDAIDNFKIRTMLPKTARHERLLEDFRENHYLYLFEAVQAHNAEPYAVINHGDCWTNNILFKYAEDSSIPQHLCFLDFQMSRFASPVTDLAYFFFTCTDKKMRDQHYDQLMNDYYRSVSENIWLLGSDPVRLFPFEAFQDQLSRFGKYGLGMAFLALPLFMCDPKDAPVRDTLADMILDMTDKTDVVCWERMNEVIEDMVERNYLGA